MKGWPYPDSADLNVLADFLLPDVSAWTAWVNDKFAAHRKEEEARKAALCPTCGEPKKGDLDDEIPF